MMAPGRRGELIHRVGASIGALVCLGGLWIVSHQIWIGLTTGRIRGKYGWTLREERPIMFEIGMALNLLAALIWIAFGALAIWLAFTGRRHGPWR